MYQNRRTKYNESYEALQSRYQATLKIMYFKYTRYANAWRIFGMSLYLVVISFLNYRRVYKFPNALEPKEFFDHLLLTNLLYFFPLLICIGIGGLISRNIIIKKYLCKDYLNESWFLQFYIIQVLNGMLLMGAIFLLLFVMFIL